MTPDELRAALLALPMYLTPGTYHIERAREAAAVEAMLDYVVYGLPSVQAGGRAAYLAARRGE